MPVRGRRKRRRVAARDEAARSDATLPGFVREGAEQADDSPVEERPETGASDDSPSGPRSPSIVGLAVFGTGRPLARAAATHLMSGPAVEREAASPVGKYGQQWRTLRVVIVRKTQLVTSRVLRKVMPGVICVQRGPAYEWPQPGIVRIPIHPTGWVTVHAKLVGGHACTVVLRALATWCI